MSAEASAAWSNYTSTPADATLHHTFMSLLPRDTLHKHGLCRRSVSVRLSVTFVRCVETAKDTVAIEVV